MAQKKTFDDTPLDAEEAASMEALEAALDRGELRNELTSERKAQVEASARATMNPPKKQISARLSERDLTRLKARALEKGIPYQTLLSSIVHQYVEGQLVERG